MIPRVAELMAWEQQHGAAVVAQPERLWLYSLARLLGATRILELGVNVGGSLSWLAAAAADNVDAFSAANIDAGPAHVVGVDDWSGDTGGGGRGGPEKAQARLRELALKAEIITSPTRAFLPQADAGYYDLIHVDACHRYKEALYDVLQSIRLAPKMVVVHDVNLGIDDVRMACKDAAVTTGFRPLWFDGSVTGPGTGAGAHG